jgi:hypothetical protein
MTLILSCITEKYAIQVSDRRLTDRDGNLVDDYENKVTQYGNDIAFGFSGAAYIGNKRTYEWLADVLGSTQEPGQIFNEIARRATEAFVRIPSSNPMKRLAIAGVGWGKFTNDSPLVGIYVAISNSFERFEWLSKPKDKFEISGVWLKDKYLLLPPLGQSVPKRDWDRLNKNIRRCVDHNATPIEIVRLLGQTIRRVAKTNKTISQNLLAVVVPKESVGREEVLFMTSHNPRAPILATPMFFDIPASTDRLMKSGPSLVIPGGVTFYQVRFGYTTPEMAHYEEQIRSGTIPSELNEASLAAYANVAQPMQEWEDYLRTLGRGTITGPAFATDTLKLAKSNDFNSLHELDRYLRNSLTWGKDYIREYFAIPPIDASVIQGDEPTVSVERIAIIDALIRKKRKFSK